MRIASISLLEMCSVNNPIKENKPYVRSVESWFAGPKENASRVDVSY